MSKRLLSVLTALCLVITMIPLTAHAEPADVDYTVPSINAPILNAINGDSSDYINSFVRGYYYYNTIDEFKSSGTAAYISSKLNSGTYTWSGFGNTALGTLSNSGELEIGLAGTFNNDVGHKHGSLLKKYTMNPYAYMNLQQGSSSLKGLTGGCSEAYSNTSTRLGDCTYTELNADRGMGLDLSITFGSSKIEYKDNTYCTHANGSVQYVTVCFRDKTYPSINKIWLTGGSDNLNFKAGDTIQIHIKFSEAVRFADNSKAHGDTYVNLLPEGVQSGGSGALKANLKSLKYTEETQSPSSYKKYFSEAVFEYTVPAGNTDMDLKVASVDLSPLKKDCNMYFYGNGWSEKNVFNASVVFNAKGFSGYGYKSAKSVFTDLAGNSFSDFGTKPVTAYIDCCSPTVIGTNASAVLNNGAIKDNKQKYGITSGSKNYLDASDNYLASGDSITFTAYFGEVLNWTDADVTKIKAETNLVSGGKPVVLKVSSASGSYGKEYKGGQYGKGYSGGNVSYVTFDEQTITADMTCSDDNGQIKITKIYFDGIEVSDFSANKYSDGDKSLDTIACVGQYYLDNVAPKIEAVSGGSGLLGDGINTTDGFYFGVNISDTRNVSGSSSKSNPAAEFLSYADGCFKLINSVNTSESFGYQWAVSALPNPGSLDWKNASSKNEVSFEEFENTYFFIKFNDTETYNLSGLTLSVKASDAPGNVSGWQDFGISYTLDNVGPSLSEASASRSVDPGTGVGTISVDITASDPSGFSAASSGQIEYQWLESASSAPDDDAWTDAQVKGTYTEGGTTITATALHTVEPAGSYSGCLAVRMTDKWGNKASDDAGEYTYNLSAPAYKLIYSSGVQNTPKVQLNSLPSDSAVLTLSRTSDMLDGNTPVWFLNYTENNKVYLLSSETRLVTVQENGNYYRFTDYEGTNEWSGYLAEDSYNNSLHGELDVKLLSGNKEAFVTSEAAISLDTVSGAGSSSYPVYTENFTLKVAGYNAFSSVGDRLDADLTLSGEGISSRYADLTANDGYEVLATTGAAILTDLTGISVDIDICDKIVPSWGTDAIDFSKTYLRIQRLHKNSGGSLVSDYIDIPLKAVKHQTMSIPKYVTDELGNGMYSFCLYVTMKSGTFGTVHFDDIDHVMVDATPVSSGADIEKYKLKISNGILTDENRTLDSSAPAYYYRNEYKPEYVSIDRSSILSEEADNAAVNTIVIPVSKAVIPDDMGPDNTGSGGFETCFRLYVDDYASNYSDVCYDSGEYELKTGVSWIKITNTVGSSSIEKWVLLDNAKGTNKDEYGNYKELLFHPVDTTEEMCSLEDSFIGNNSKSLAVVRNTVNKLTFEVYALNGRVSSQRSMYILPKSDPVTGSVSNVSMSHNDDTVNDVTPSMALAKDMRTIFTPAPGTDTSNLRAYINFSYNDAGGHPDMEMSLSEDGTYFYIDRDPSYGYNFWGSRIFFISIVNTDTGYVSSQYTDYNNGYYWPEIRDSELGMEFDTDAPSVMGMLMSDTGGGTYAFSFTLEDQVLKEGGEISMTLSPTDEYRAALGTGEGEVFEYTIARGEDNNWSVGSSGERLGIYEIKVKTYDEDCSLDYDQAYITVRGVVPGNSATEGQKINAGFDISIKDRFDNSMTTSVSKDVVSHEPAITNVESEFSTGPDFRLKAVFNQPVMVGKSWICQTPSGYGTSKTDELPITADTSGTVTVTDVFGNSHEAAYDVQGEFDFSTIAYGVDVEFTTTELTTGMVGITVSRHDMDRSYPEIVNPLHPDESGSSQTVYVTENGWYEFKIYYSPGAYDLDKNTGKDYAKSLMVYVGNIAKSAPEAELYFYFDEFKQGYKESNLPNMLSDGSYSELLTSGYVTVSYTAERDVTPADGSSGSVRFSYRDGADGSYTFEYADVLGNVGSKSFSLSDYGIVLEAPPVPPVDSEAPMISGYIYSLEGSSYVNRAAFDETTSPSAISTSLGEIGRVQGYKVVLNVYDETSTKTVIKSADPGSLTYTDAASDEITGVTLRGNTLYIDPTAEGSVWISVVDNAAAETEADSDHTRTIEIPVDASLFDTTAPLADISSKYTSLYSVDYYVELSDKDNSGTDISSLGDITLYSSDFERDTVEPTTAEGHQKYKYTFNENKTIDFSYSDMAGNMGASSIKVDTLDTTAPTLTETWSPGAKYTDNGITRIDTSLPPNYVINTDLKVKIESDKGIQHADVYVMTAWSKPSYDDSGWTLVDENYTGDVVSSVSISPDAVNIVFDKDGDSYYGGWAKVVVTGYNGKVTSLVTGFEFGTIDAEPIQFIVTAEPITKQGCTAPYGYKIKIWPTIKECYCNNESAHTDASGVTTRNTYYCPDPSSPSADNTGYEANIYTNSTYTWKFTDAAGNVASVKIDMPDSPGEKVMSYEYSRPDYSMRYPLDDGIKTRQTVYLEYIDRTAPVITVSPDEDTLAAMPAVGSSGVDITLTADEACTIKYSNGGTPVSTSLAKGGSTTVNIRTNGIFSFTATDAAGNTSIKSVSVGNIDNSAPVIVFEESTLSIRQDSAAEELQALLDAGVSAYDIQGTAKTSLTCTYDSSSVDLSTVGLYKVTYSAVDDAGNTATLDRYVEVYDRSLPGIKLDGSPAKINGLTVLRPGSHTVTVTNLKEITPGEEEPYNLYIRKGISSAGQMKGTQDLVKVGADGSVTLTEGYYTIFVITQSRQSFRTMLYIQK